jgi:hypothetical protein
MAPHVLDEQESALRGRKVIVPPRSQRPVDAAQISQIGLASENPELVLLLFIELELIVRADPCQARPVAPTQRPADLADVKGASAQVPSSSATSRTRPRVLAAVPRPSQHQRKRPAHDNQENVMNYHGLVKRLDLPAGWMPPAELEYDDIRARAISRADNDDDVRGINASIELIRRTRGGRWPTEPVSADFNYVDEVWHECEFREGDSFTYAVYDSRGQYLGCCYLYPMGRRTPLTEELLTYDVDVSWWVTPDAYERGYYAKLYAALRHWIETAFPFTKAYYSNTEIPELPG